MPHFKTPLSFPRKRESSYKLAIDEADSSLRWNDESGGILGKKRVQKQLVFGVKNHTYFGLKKFEFFGEKIDIHLLKKFSGITILTY